MNGRGRKQKGMNGEYEVRDMLQKLVDEVYTKFNEKWMKERPDVERPHIIEIPELNRNLEQTRVGGSDLVGLPWAAIEIKRQENDSMFNQWWLQCKSAAVARDGDGKAIDGKYDREPILIWRKNHCPWEIRMLGFLAVGGDTRNGQVRAPVDINLSTFQAYFRLRLEVDLIAVAKRVESENRLKLSAEAERIKLAHRPLVEHLVEKAQKRPNIEQSEAKLHESGAKEHETASICDPCAFGHHWRCMLYLSSGGPGGSGLRHCCCPR